MNEAHLNRYAQLLVEHGVGLRRDQPLFIHGAVAHRDLVRRVAEAAYDRDGGSVSFWLDDPLLQAQLIRRGRLEELAIAHQDEQRWFDEILRSRGALISLRGDEFPRLMTELAENHGERHRLYTRSASQARAAFHAHGINRSLCPWLVAGAVTDAWAQQVFPDLDTKMAVDRLWELIFSFTFADQEDARGLAAAKDRRLHARRKVLNRLQIRAVHIHGGNSDLRVGLTPRARWLGGSKLTVFGQTFNANMPSEENFTTPDRRLTEGRLAATMPFRTKSGALVKDLVMEFRQGRLESFEASEGAEAFGHWIDSDPGARYLGELALVGHDSAIAKSGLFFEHTLYDENAWPHVAIGKAYATALAGGESLTGQQLVDLGCNESTIHTDIMYGSPEVSITATETNQGEVPIIERGRWTAPFIEPEA